MAVGSSLPLSVPTGVSEDAALGDSPSATVGVVVEAPAPVVTVALVVPVALVVVVAVAAVVVVTAVVVVATVVVVAAVVVVTAVVVVAAGVVVVVVAAPTTVKVADALSPAPPMLWAVTECGPMAAPAGTFPEYLKVPSELTR